MIIYGDTNAKISHNRIKWNIKASTEVPDENTPGQIGDVIIVTSVDVKKIKDVATIAGSEELQDNAINAYLDFSQQRILVNESKGFDMFLFAALQNVVLNGETIIANVYFYDGLTNEWVECQSAYREALNLSSFSAKNLIPQIDELWHGLTYEDDINDDPGDTPIQPTIVKPEANDSMIIANFSGAGIDVDTEWAGLSLQDGATIKNLTNDNVIPV